MAKIGTTTISGGLSVLACSRARDPKTAETVEGVLTFGAPGFTLQTLEGKGCRIVQTVGGVAHDVTDQIVAKRQTGTWSAVPLRRAMVADGCEKLAAKLAGVKIS